MKRSMRFLAVCLLLLLCAAWTAAGAAAASGGWVRDGVGWWYRDADGGYPAAAWRYIDGAWYHFDGAGYMQTGWVCDGGTWYWLDASGAMATGWQKVGGVWYFLDPSGAMRTGWVFDGGWYYLDASGAMRTGWLEDGGRWYYLTDSGSACADEWLSSGLQWYYFGGDAAMVTDETVTLGTRTYRFDAEGRWITPLQEALEGTETAARVSQLILVVDHELTYWERTDAGLWIRRMETYCGYGKNGLTAAGTRRAGTLTTPIGAFPITLAFGTANDPGAKMTYRRITADSYWSSENDETYNTWVESAAPIEGEHLIDYYQYKYAMAIGFNIDPAVYGRGSAIFLHCKSTDHWYTAGCVSLAEDDMLWLMQRLRDGAYIIIVPDTASLAAY